MTRNAVIAAAVATVLALLAYTIRFAGWDEASDPDCAPNCSAP